MRTAPHLNVTRENILFRLKDLIKLVERPQRVEVLAATIQAICEQYRRLALCELLADADLRAFRNSLYASGQAYLYLLSRVDWADLVDRYYLCASRAQAFFDSVAIDDLASARTMAKRSAQEFSEGDEYPEDFAYMRFLMAAVEPGPGPQDDEAAWLKRLKDSMPASDSRLGVCQALNARSAPKFEKAFARLILDRELAMDEALKEPTTDPEMKITERHVFIEGLAILRLASTRGLSLERDYRSIPPLALTPSASPYPGPTAWRQVG
jgi:hypothetical protein